MDAFVVMTCGGPRCVCWTRESAEEELAFGRQQWKEEWRIEAVEIDSLCVPVMGYFAFRGYKTPDPIQAFLFLASEVGELADRLVQAQSAAWVRNHPESKSADPQGEIADVLMMLTALCSALNLDPVELMLEKFKSKGFDPDKKPDGYRMKGDGYGRKRCV